MPYTPKQYVKGPGITPDEAVPQSFNQYVKSPDGETQGPKLPPEPQEQTQEQPAEQPAEQPQQAPAAPAEKAYDFFIVCTQKDFDSIWGDPEHHIGKEKPVVAYKNIDDAKTNRQPDMIVVKISGCPVSAIVGYINSENDWASLREGSEEDKQKAYDDPATRVYELYLYESRAKVKSEVLSESRAIREARALTVEEFSKLFT